MTPQSAVGGWVPRPMKLKPAPVRTAEPKSSVPCTNTGVRTLGRMWRQMMVRFFTPMPRAASMNERSRSEIVWARTRRVYQGHQVKAIANIALMKFGPRAAAMAIASSSGGNARKTSVTRMMTSSIQPPRNPATAPSGVPMITATRTTSRPIDSEVRVPNMIRASMSRPKLSVPNMCSGLGDRNLLGRLGSPSPSLA